jgi:hypothetical protein
MKNVSKVKMSAYKKLNDDELAVFANSLIDNGKDKVFDPFRATLEIFSTEMTDYATKLQKAKNKGIVEVEAKNSAKETLLLRIDEYSLLVSSLALRDSAVIGKSGFESHTKTVNRPSPTMELTPPYALSVKYGKNTGEVELSYKLEMPKRVVKNGIEWSENDGETWNNGTYFSGRKGIVRNLPTRKDLLLRVRSIGAYNRESGFSSAVATFLP